MRRFAAIAVVCLAAGGLTGQHLDAADPSPGAHRAFVAGVARGKQVAANPSPPPAGAGYCAPSGAGAPVPPNAVLGLLTVAGAPAPAGTLVTLTFDGLPGPSAYTVAPGGYRINYAAGGQGHSPPCTNVVGSQIGLLVNGILTESGVAVGDPQGRLVLRFDVAVP